MILYTCGNPASRGYRRTRGKNPAFRPHNAETGDSPAKKHHTTEVPPELLKSLTAEARVDGKWVELGSLDKNRTRLIKLDFDKVRATAVRIHLKETYGNPTAKLFEVRCY